MASNNNVPSLTTCVRCKHLVCRCAKLFLVLFEAPGASTSNAASGHAASGHAAPEWFNRLLAGVGASSRPPPSVHVPDTDDPMSSAQSSDMFPGDATEIDLYLKFYKAAKSMHTYRDLLKGVDTPALPDRYSSPLYVAMEMEKPDPVRRLAILNGEYTSGAVTGAASSSGGSTVATSPGGQSLATSSQVSVLDAASSASSEDLSSGTPRIVLLHSGEWLHLPIFVVSSPPVELDSASDGDEMMTDVETAAVESSDFVDPALRCEDPDQEFMNAFYTTAMKLLNYLNDVVHLPETGRPYLARHAEFVEPLYIAFEVTCLSDTATHIPSESE